VLLSRRSRFRIAVLSTGFLYDGNDIAAEIGGGAVGANYLRGLTIDEPLHPQTGPADMVHDRHRQMPVAVLIRLRQ